MKNQADTASLHPSPAQSDHDEGLYEKFVVKRTDGSSEPGGRHDGCHYFVLDRTHDPHAVVAILAYADSCEDGYPVLAADIRALYSEETKAKARKAFSALIGRHRDARLAAEAEVARLRAEVEQQQVWQSAFEEGMDDLKADLAETKRERDRFIRHFVVHSEFIEDREEDDRWAAMNLEDNTVESWHETREGAVGRVREMFGLSVPTSESEAV